MPKKHIYVLGLNTYDHDVSACLLRDGAIAYAIGKERLTREKHATGFYQEVIDYCLEAEGIALADVDLVVRNCYIMPVPDMEERLTYQDMPGFLPPPERAQAEQHPYFRSNSDKVVSISHHLAHAYSAFAASPFEEGAVMIVDGVGSYRADAMEELPADDTGNPLARESESYYGFSGARLDCLKKVWLEPSRGMLNEEFYSMPGLGALYSRASTYVFGDWNKCGELMGLAPYGRRDRFRHLLEIENGELRVPSWNAEFKQPYLVGTGDWEKSSSMPHWEDLAWRVQDDTENVLLARARWLRETTGAKNLCLAGGVALNCVANGKLQEAGIVKGTRLKVDTKKLGYDITAFVGIYLEKSSLYDDVAEELKKIPEIVRLNYTTGNYSMFLEIVCHDINQLRSVLHDHLQKIKGIERTETLISLEEGINRNVKISL